MSTNRNVLVWRCPCLATLRLNSAGGYKTIQMFTKLLLWLQHVWLLQSNEKLACCEQIAYFSSYSRWCQFPVQWLMKGQPGSLWRSASSASRLDGEVTREEIWVELRAWLNIFRRRLLLRKLTIHIDFSCRPLRLISVHVCFSSEITCDGASFCGTPPPRPLNHHRGIDASVCSPRFQLGQD